MPGWAVGVIVGVVVSTGGYIIRMLIKISGTLGKIDSNIENNSDRILALETIHPRTSLPTLLNSPHSRRDTGGPRR